MRNPFTNKKGCDLIVFNFFGSFSYPFSKSAIERVIVPPPNGIASYPRAALMPLGVIVRFGVKRGLTFKRIFDRKTTL